MVQTKFDATSLHQRTDVASEARMVDDGTGMKEVFRVDNFDLVQVQDGMAGKFYSGDCYVILYAYSNGSSDSYLIYFWLVGYLHSFQNMVCLTKKATFFGSREPTLLWMSKARPL